jgi:multicomponent Na+:H+ antiporter subunit D
VGGGVLTSLLTLYAIAKAWNLAFWRTPEQAHEVLVSLPESKAELAHSAGPAVVRAADEEESQRDLHELLEAGELPERLPRSMTGATAALVAVSLAITVFAGPLYAYADRAAQDLTSRDPYIGSVLPGGSR